MKASWRGRNGEIKENEEDRLLAPKKIEVYAGFRVQLLPDDVPVRLARNGAVHAVHEGVARPAHLIPKRKLPVLLRSSEA